MRFLSLFLLGSMLTTSVMAQTSVSQECEEKVARAETNQDVAV